MQPTWIALPTSQKIVASKISDSLETQETRASARADVEMQWSQREQVARMITGELFVKYAMRRRNAARRDVYYRPLADLSSDLGCIFWSEPGKRWQGTARHGIDTAKLARLTTTNIIL